MKVTADNDGSGRAKTLEVTADLKATQIAGDIGLYEDLAQAVSTRSTIQALLKAYRDGNHTVGPALGGEVCLTVPLHSLY